MSTSAIRVSEDAGWKPAGATRATARSPGGGIFAMVAEFGISAIGVTVGTLFKLSYPRASAIIHLLRFPMDAVAPQRPRPPLRTTLGAPREERSSQVCPGSEILAAYIDSTIMLKERAAIEAHLAECAGCRKTVAVAVIIPT